MKKVPFSFDWNRIDGRPRWWTNDQETTPVNLPDDFTLNKHRDPNTPSGASNGFIPGGEATYIKSFDFDPSWEGKKVLLYIDGAYMNAEVTLNKDLLSRHPYGYTAFMTDLTPSLYKEYPNRLSIATESIQPNSRWYSGGGIYREVSLYVGGSVRIEPWELFVTTPAVSADKATVHVDANITNDGRSKKAKLVITLTDKNGKKTSTELPLQLAKGVNAVQTDLTVEDPLLWDVDDPNLYDLSATVTAGKETDTYTDTVGIRKIEIDFDHGFRLNGKPMKLRGGCIHHDNTLLGACAFPRAEERKIEILKAGGYNAIRCAHNPPSTAMLDVCDRLGMLVLDESFDMWNMGKNTLDYHLFFDKWWQFDTASMVKRDRNHPCVYCWSIGNEIPEITGKGNGAYWAKVQADYVRSLDPTRPVTSAIHGGTDIPPEIAAKGLGGRPDRKKSMVEGNTGKPNRIIDGHDLWAEQTAEPASALDIVGYNYLWDRYEGDRITFPKRIIHATETHSYTTYDYWKAVEANSNVIGDFIWTAYDNLGEAGAGRVIWDLNEPMTGLIGQYPWLSCYQGDMDLDGNRRPQNYYRNILWGLDKGIWLFTTDPEHTGVPYYGMGWHWADVKQNWTFEEKYIGQPVQLEAYADCDEVAFYVNGELKGTSKVEKLKAFLTVDYQPGKVEAAAIKDGKEVARCELRTAGKAAKIVLTPDRPAFNADGMDLCFIRAELQDANGERVQPFPVELSVSVSGKGTLAGLGSGCPKTTEDFGTGRRITFDGRCLIAVRSEREAGPIEVCVTAAGLPASILTVETK